VVDVLYMILSRVKSEVRRTSCRVHPSSLSSIGLSLISICTQGRRLASNNIYSPCKLLPTLRGNIIISPPHSYIWALVHPFSDVIDLLAPTRTHVLLICYAPHILLYSNFEVAERSVMSTLPESSSHYSGSPKVLLCIRACEVNRDV
jgi:hypothetical protein